MKHGSVAIGCVMLLAACTSKSGDIEKGASALSAIANASKNVPKHQEEGDKLVAQRKAKGDTTVVPYKELQSYLPAPTNGYALSGGPAGQQNDFPLSMAEQKYAAASPDGRRINVSIIDYGGSDGGLSMIMMMDALNMSVEDDHKRASSVTLDLPFTVARQEYEKSTHDATVTIGMRYRYLITVKATGQSSDATPEMLAIATQVATKFANK